jgi:hypothetical protein
MERLKNKAMTHQNYFACEYCSTKNPAGATSCLACGAPIEYHQPLSSPKATTKPRIDKKSKKRPEEEFKKVGEKVDEAYFTVLKTYAIAWRTVAEAIAIAVAAFIIGTAGGAAGIGFLGILGGIALGITVGLTQKNFYIALISAPGGAMIGLLVGAIFWVIGNPKIFPLIVTLFSILGAVIGGRRKPTFSRRNWWEKLRPFFGALGGLVFSALGAALGWGILSTIKLFQ